MDRKAYKFPFRKDGRPQWVCPTCKKGVLRIQKDTFNEKETFTSRRERASEEWDQQSTEYVYSCLFLCSNVACRDVIANSGVGFGEFDFVLDENDEATGEWSYIYRPKYFSPHLKIFQYPRNTPANVGEAIEKSFELFFSNPPSAANHIRVALENLLTHLKVKRFNVSKGRRLFINLHSRIELLPKSYSELKDLFLAIKWLGNAGSHSTKEITMDDCLDDYEIMEELLQKLYDTKGKYIKQLARMINKKKGSKNYKSA